MRTTLHAIRNHLAVAIASAEAFRDGVLQPTPERLDVMLDALASIDVLLRELPREPVVAEYLPRTGSIDLCDVVVNEALSLRAGAKERGIDVRVHTCGAEGEACLTFAGDPVRIAEIVGALVGAVVRDASPGTRIDVGCRRAGESLMIEIADEGDAPANGVQRDVKATIERCGGTFTVRERPGGGREITVLLPARPFVDGSISLL